MMAAKDDILVKDVCAERGAAGDSGNSSVENSPRTDELTPVDLVVRTLSRLAELSTVAQRNAENLIKQLDSEDMRGTNTEPSDEELFLPEEVAKWTKEIHLAQSHCDMNIYQLAYDIPTSLSGDKEETKDPSWKRLVHTLEGQNAELIRLCGQLQSKLERSEDTQAKIRHFCKDFAVKNLQVQAMTQMVAELRTLGAVLTPLISNNSTAFDPTAQLSCQTTCTIPSPLAYERAFEAEEKVNQLQIQLESTEMQLKLLQLRVELASVATPSPTNDSRMVDQLQTELSTVTHNLEESQRREEFLQRELEALKSCLDDLNTFDDEEDHWQNSSCASTSSAITLDCSARAIHASLGALDENMRLVSQRRKDLRQYRTELKTLRETNVTLIKQNESLKWPAKWQEGLEAKNLALLEEKAAVEQQLEELRHNCHDSDALRALVKALERTVESQMDQLHQKDAKIDQLTVDLEIICPELSRVKSEAAELQACRTRADQQWLEKMKLLQEENDRLKVNEQQIELREQSDTSGDRCKALQDEIASLTEQLERANMQVAAVKDVREAYRVQKSSLDETQLQLKEKSSQLKDMEILLDEYIHEKEALSGQVHNLQAAYGQLQTDIQAKSASDQAEIRRYLDEINQFLLRFEDKQADRSEDEEVAERQVLLDGLQRILSAQLKIVEENLLKPLWDRGQTEECENLVELLVELGQKYHNGVEELRNQDRIEMIVLDNSAVEKLTKKLTDSEAQIAQLTQALSSVDSQCQQFEELLKKDRVKEDQLVAELKEVQREKRSLAATQDQLRRTEADLKFQVELAERQHVDALHTIATMKDSVAEDQLAYAKLQTEYSALLKEMEQTKAEKIDVDCLADLTRVKKEVLAERYAMEFAKCRVIEQKLKTCKGDFRVTLLKKINYKYKYDRLRYANKTLCYHKSWLATLLKQYQNPQGLFVSAGYEPPMEPQRPSFKVVAVSIRAALKLTRGGLKFRQRLTSIDEWTARLSLPSNNNSQTATDFATLSFPQSTLNRTDLGGGDGEDLVPVKLPSEWGTPKKSLK